MGKKEYCLPRGFLGIITSYDVLQYPLLFVNGKDGYHFNIIPTNHKTAISCIDLSIKAYSPIISNNHVVSHYILFFL